MFMYNASPDAHPGAAMMGDCAAMGACAPARPMDVGLVADGACPYVPPVSPSIAGGGACGAPVAVTNVVALANPSSWGTPLSFEVTFECERALPDDLEWALVYVGSADDSRYDQVLAEVEVGPVPVGTNRFVLSGGAPDPAAIPADDVLGVTVVLVTCAYRGAEFLKIGYYVSNECPEGCAVTPDTVTRTILAESPRVTRIDVDWASLPPRDSEEGAGMAD